ncbi:hypothetical protein [Fluviicola sp.]|uniref:hypothetical protein n=1 Tax=Fluviicola sp. TaxID=1917219 RepID=UPI0031E2C787
MIQFLRSHVRILLLASIFLLAGVLVLKSHGKHWRNEVINSDGKGYYYFLPALFQGENDYRKTLQQEEQVMGKPPQNYILKTEEGKHVNKCYPGVAILQTPSFLVACGMDFLLGNAFHGYSDTHLYFFFWTNVLLLFLAVLLLKSNLANYFGQTRFTWLIAFLTVFATNIGYQAFFYPALSHQYTFFLVNVWMYYFLKWKNEGKTSSLLWFAGVSGVLFLVRPTNLLFFLILPFLAKDWKTLKALFTDLFALRNGKLVKACVAFLIPVSVLPLLTYWQTGHFLYWSYQGEGFIFNGSHWLATWISYRCGILLHTPLVLFGMVGIFAFWRRETFPISMLLIALGCITFVLSSWWCWDYQLFFGHRGFTEYQVITAFLLMYFVRLFRRSWVVYGLLVLPVGYMAIRTYQKIANSYPVQKFTAVTYWKSLFDFDTQTKEKYVVLTNCQPYGKILATYDLMKGKERYRKVGVGSDPWTELVFEIPTAYQHCRFYLEIHANKKLMQATTDWKGVSLIFQGTSRSGEIVHYAGCPFYNYYREGTGKWAGFDIAEEYNPAEDGTEKITVFIWNPENKAFEIDDFRATIKAITSKK